MGDSLLGQRRCQSRSPPPHFRAHRCARASCESGPVCARPASRLSSCRGSRPGRGCRPAAARCRWGRSRITSAALRVARRRAATSRNRSAASVIRPSRRRGCRPSSALRASSAASASSSPWLAAARWASASRPEVCSAQARCRSPRRDGDRSSYTAARRRGCGKVISWGSRPATIDRSSAASAWSIDATVVLPARPRAHDPHGPAQLVHAPVAGPDRAPRRHRGQLGLRATRPPPASTTRSRARPRRCRKSRTRWGQWGGTDEIPARHRS
jgi:hypothetical protein